MRHFFVYRGELEEIVREPEFMLRDLDTLGRLEGDCDDIATFAAAVLLAAGYAVRFVAIRYTPGQTAFEHVFTEVFEAGQWSVIDPTLPGGTRMIVLEEMIEAV